MIIVTVSSRGVILYGDEIEWALDCGVITGMPLLKLVGLVG